MRYLRSTLKHSLGEHVKPMLLKLRHLLRSLAPKSMCTWGF